MRTTVKSFFVSLCPICRAIHSGDTPEASRCPYPRNTKAAEALTKQGVTIRG